MKRNLGFTLVELMVTLAVLVILISIAIPSFMNMIQNSRSAALANSIVIALNVARSEAVKRNALIDLCPSSDGATCMATPDWTVGWIAQQNGGAAVQVWDAPDAGAVITQVGGATTIQYDGSGLMRLPAAPPVIINSRYPNCTGLQARQIQISVTGRVSVQRTACP